MEEFINKVTIKDNVILVLDHDLGGGTNHYRQRKINVYIQLGYSVLLLVSEHRFESNTVAMTFFCEGEQFTSPRILSFESLNYISKLPFKRIFINSIVSFKPATQFLKSLLTFVKKSTTDDISIAFHDYYAICPSYNLLNYQWQFCNVPDEETCRKCQSLHPIDTLRERDAENWRYLWEELLSFASQVLVFSSSSNKILIKGFPTLKGKLKVVPHSMEYYSAQPIELKSHNSFNIGIVGDMALHKGSNVVLKLSEYLDKYSSESTLTIFGNFNEGLNKNRITVLGSYEHDNLANMIEKHEIDVFLFPSICPETFSYVIEELMILKQKIVCFGIGAQGDKVNTYIHGKTLALDVDIKKVMSTLLEMKN